MAITGVVKVSISELKQGMFVSELDRPWLETPFLLQGFMVHTMDDIEQLRKHCDYVYIDVVKGKTPTNYDPRMVISNPDSINQGGGAGKQYSVKPIRETPVAPKKPSITVLSRTPATQKALEKMFPNRKLKVYVDKTPVKKELHTAKVAFSDLTQTIADMTAEMQRSKVINVERVKTAVDPMVDSVMRNPDACMWLARLKNKDSYTFKHSMGSAVWAVALGRQIGLPKIDLKNLAIGTMLCDIGKLKLPKDLLNKKGRLNRGEFALIRYHVQLGLETLQETEGMNRQILDIVAFHHERFNGKGYPNKLKGAKIPVLARIAAIADCYDAMTSERTYAKAISPSVAVRKLYEWRNEDFQAELIEEFIQAVGLYPAGTLVELSNGSVGIVVGESRTRRLRPKLLMLLDTDKKQLDDVFELDLMEVVHEEGTQESLFIANSLSPGSYGIDPESLYY